MNDNDLQKKVWDQLLEEEKSKLSGYLREDYTFEELCRRMLFGDFQDKYTQEALDRNMYGQVMYTKECDQCYKHMEEWITCDVCDQKCVVKRVHLASERWEGMPFPRLQAAQQWDQELFHACPRTKRFLTHLLTTIIL